MLFRSERGIFLRTVGIIRLSAQAFVFPAKFLQLGAKLPFAAGRYEILRAGRERGIAPRDDRQLRRVVFASEGLAHGADAPVTRRRSCRSGARS